MDLKDMLEKCVSNMKYDPDANKPSSDEHVSKICKKPIDDDSYAKIPKFYEKVPSADNVLLQRIREEARSNFLHRRDQDLLKNEELKALWLVLDEHQIKSNDDEGYIPYTSFKKIQAISPPKQKKYFKPSVYAKLLQTENGFRVKTTSLFNYIMRKVWLHQTRIGLSVYDNTGEGYLRQNDLESYIEDLMPTLPQLDGLEKSYRVFYVFTAVRKFMFFLDPLCIGRVRILDILASGFLDELIELRDKDAPKEDQASNWFSASSALRVYGDYLNLDKDHNGMLSKEELSGYGTGTLTQVFIDRVYQECLTFNGEIDYKTYLDFVLALENRNEPQSIMYLFRILDIHGKGYLDVFSLRFFFKAIQDLMKTHGQEPVLFENIQDEIFDMVRPAKPDKITVKDLLKCEQGGTVISILIDLNGFWNYENRETPPTDIETDINNANITDTNLNPE